MTLSKHAHQRMNERITWFNYFSAKQFAEKEVRKGITSFIFIKDGRKKAKVINNGIIYIVDVTDPKDETIITVFLETEEEEWE
ncbi:MAG: hypothetical protein ABGX20_18815 [Bacillus sp. (in: firmicutes)]